MNESAGGVVRNSEGNIILVEQHGNSWSFPKGHVEEGESALEAAQREISEETGITDLVFQKELGSYERYSISKDGTGENKEWGMRKRTLFLFSTTQKEFTIHDPGGEITNARWVSLDEALELLTHPKDREFLRSVRSTIES